MHPLRVSVRAVCTGMIPCYLPSIGTTAGFGIFFPAAVSNTMKHWIKPLSAKCLKRPVATHKWETCCLSVK